MPRAWIDLAHVEAVAVAQPVGDHPPHRTRCARLLGLVFPGGGPGLADVLG